MKRLGDSRHKKRQRLIEALFKFEFAKQHIKPDARAIVKHLREIDGYIQKIAPRLPLNQINKIDLAILRLAIYEIVLQKESRKVAIDEAIELAKEYGSESSSSFINGSLGNLDAINSKSS